MRTLRMQWMAMLVLACCSVAFAQGDMSGQSNKKSDKGMMGKKMSITGCISEKDGKYWIMDDKHPNGVQLMSSEDLKPHVGHKVKVKGMMSSMSGDNSNSGMSGAANSGMSGAANSGMSGSASSGTSSGSMSGNNSSGMSNNSGSMGSNNSGMDMMSMNVTEMKMKSDHCEMGKMK